MGIWAYDTYLAESVSTASPLPLFPLPLFPLLFALRAAPMPELAPLMLVLVDGIV
jgi:hypothetical protein